MKKALSILVITSTILLSGCMSEASDDLFQAPKLPGDYVALQSVLDEITASGAISAVPDSGSNRHSVQLVDIDADGFEEAVSFFRDAPGGTQFSVYLHKKTDDGSYSLIGSMSGHGTSIDRVYYPRCSETGARAVVLSLSSGEDISGNLIAGYIKSGIFSNILETTCTDIYVGNINESINDELVIIQKGGDVSQFSAKMYYFDNNLLNSMPPASLSAGIKGIVKIRKSNTSDGQPAVFIDALSAGKGYITDVLSDRSGTFTNITLDTTSGISDSTYRQISMPASDISGNGVYSIPLAYPMKSDADISEPQWRLEWNSVSSDGSLSHVLTTYHNVSEEWYVIFPDKWSDEKITVKKEKSSYGSFTTFCELKGGKNSAPLFSLYSVAEDDKLQFDKQSQYICIGANSSKSYYISLNDQNKNSRYFLSEDEIRTIFNIIPKVWAAEVYGS